MRHHILCATAAKAQELKVYLEVATTNIKCTHTLIITPTLF